ncbi:hypothetical protein EIP91_002819 [Steccherinum ochraceum]|uniref:Endoplasmic reticulum zinc transporter n=1 Tax=Steccherinum ochraceum TaxID=92696 RepID=A0A4R0RS45_9APHY|nr:hypothetical protein EIP91_002819 [Steccherinum ochraceum]
MSVTSSSATAVHIHRRKSSREEDENVLVFPNSLPTVSPTGISPTDGERRMNGGGDVVVANGHDLTPKANGHGALGEYAPPPPQQRIRVNSNPSAPTSAPASSLPASHSHPPPHPPSAGPYRTSFAMHNQAPRSPYANGVSSHLHPGVPNGHNSRHQAPGMRQSLSLPAHSRTRSVSGPFSPSSPSPLSMSFPASNSTPAPSTSNTPGHRRQGSTSAPSYPDLQNPFSAARSVSMSGAPSHGVTPSSSVSSPGNHARRHSRLHSRNLSIYFPRPGSLPSTTIAEDGAQEVDFSSTSSISTLNTPLDESGVLIPSVSSPIPGQRTFKEGFKFGARPPQDPDDPLPSPSGPAGASRSIGADPEFDFAAVAMASIQFILGATLWVSGQQVGSLACTGLGYWVVFDAFGVALGKLLPSWLSRPSMKDYWKRPYGNARMETLFIYAQSIYLIFASVYVCKETVEHLLLSHGEGHHHHSGDEVVDLNGIDFPVTLLCTILTSLITSAIAFDNQAKFVSIANNFIPSIPSLLPVRFRYRATPYTYPPYLMNLLSNPYTLSPVLFCSIILATHFIVPAHRHSGFDLILAGVETVVTFAVAYPAAVNLGAVLLQTAPPRGLPGGRMEAFLRAMREIEGHPKVLHLPAPHIWQITPTLHAPPAASYPSHLAPAFTREKLGASQNLVVTVDLHIKKDMLPSEAIVLMKWATERCRNALRLGVGDGKGGECEAHVTVGVVRG